MGLFYRSGSSRVYCTMTPVEERQFRWGLENSGNVARRAGSDRLDNRLFGHLGVDSIVVPFWVMISRESIADDFWATARAPENLGHMSLITNLARNKTTCLPLKVRY